MVNENVTEPDLAPRKPIIMTQVPWQTFSAGDDLGMRYQNLSEAAGATQICIANEVLLPGKTATRFHYHLLNEEHVIILQGSLTLRLGEEVHVLNAGHYVCFPAGQREGHSLSNHTLSDCNYLAIGIPHDADVVVFPEIDLVSVKLMGTGFRGSHRETDWDVYLTASAKGPPDDESSALPLAT